MEVVMVVVMVVVVELMGGGEGVVEAVNHNQT